MSSPRSLAGLVLILVAGPVFAQTPYDPLTAAKARQALADQKAQVDITAAIAEADRLAKGNPAKAAAHLRSALDSLDLSAAISNQARKDLVGQLQAKLTAIMNPPNPLAPKIDPKTQLAREHRDAVLTAAKKEAEVIGKAVADINRELDAGRLKEANVKISALRTAYPNNPAVQFLGGEGDVRSRVADAAELAREQDRRVILAMNDVQRSALPPLGDIEFPKDWSEKTKRRQTQVELSAREKSIIEALNAPMSILANERPFEELIQEMSNQMKQDIMVDPKSLQEAGLDLKKPVSVSGRDVSARVFLRQILASQGLTFVVQDEVIKVVTVERARNMLATKVYYLGDIVSGTGPFGGSLRWGPLLDYQQTTANVNVIIESIVNSIDPLSWKEKGGAGTVTFHFPSMSLIVRASTEVHATLGSKLGKGR